MALWQAAREDLQARGVARVVLEAGEENAAALALYRKLSFREVGRRKGYLPGSEQRVPSRRPYHGLRAGDLRESLSRRHMPLCL